MCGIAGIMNRSGAPPGDTVLQALTKALAHRGPDGHGRTISGATGLAQHIQHHLLIGAKIGQPL